MKVVYTEKEIRYTCFTLPCNGYSALKQAVVIFCFALVTPPSKVKWLPRMSHLHLRQ